MADLDPHKRALAAGFVTLTLDDSEMAEAEGLLCTDAEFAALVRELAVFFAAEDTDALPESLWLRIERRLTGQ